jgi:hypothetical protein
MIKTFNDLKNSRSSGDIKGTDELTNKLAELRTKRDDATAALERMNNEQGKAVVQTEEEVVSKGSLISSLGKWAAGLFSVAAVMKIVNDVIASTEGTAEKFEETIALLKGGIAGLYSTIATGQWDQLINNIVNAAKATRDLKAATNELSHITAGGTIERADLLAGLEKARANAASTTNDVERKKYLDEAIGYQKQITALNVSEIKDRLTIDEDYYQKLTGHTKEYYDYLLQQIPTIAKNYKTLYSQQEGDQIRLNQLKYLETTQPGGLTTAQEKERHELQLLIFTLEDYKILQDDLSKKGQWDEYIKGIGKMRTAAAQGDQALVYLNRQSETAGKATAKGAKEQLDYETEIGRKQISNQLAIDQQKLDLQKDSAEKQRAQAELDFKKRIVDIKTQQADALKAYNESPKVGGIDKETGAPVKGKYVSELPKAQQDQFDAFVLAVEKKKANDIVLINKKEAEELNKIRDEITDYRLTGIEKEKAAVKKQYDDMAREVKKVNAPDTADLLSGIEEKRARANAAIDNKYALDKLDFEEQIENKKTALSTDNEEKLQEKLFEIYVRYQKAKIEILKKSSDPKDQQDAALMQADLDVAVKTEGLEKEEKLRKSILDSATKLVEGVRQFNAGLADSLALALNVGETLSKAFSTKGLTKEESYGAIVSGATGIVSMFVNQAAQNKKTMDDYYSSVISQQQQYNLLLNEQLRLNSDVEGSVFLKDYLGRLKGGVAAFNDAQIKYQEGLKKFKDAQAVTGEKTVVSGTNVLAGIGSGAALGAGIGSIVPGIGTVVGAAVGGFVGLLAGLFAKKKKDIVAPLLETYPDLIKANGDFNDSLAQTLIDNNKVTAETKKTLQNLIDWKKAADEATAQIKQVVSDLVGELGDDLRSALVTAFEDGTNSAIAFGQAVNKVLENALSNILFNKIFEGALANLEKVLTPALETGNPEAMTKVMGDFFKQWPALTEQYNKALEAAKESAKNNGLDIFVPGDSVSGSGSSNSMTGAIKGVTEETASVLTGQINAIRIGQASSISAMKQSLLPLSDIASNIKASQIEVNALMREQLLHLSEIAANTRYNKHLESIDKKLDALESSSLRAQGLN